MSIPSFNPSMLSQYYGTSGVATGNEMAKRLRDHSLSMTFNATDKTITVLNSAGLDANAISQIFYENATNVYRGYKPEVLKATDALGNRLVKIVPISRDEESYNSVYRSPDSGSKSEASKYDMYRSMRDFGGKISDLERVDDDNEKKECEK